MNATDGIMPIIILAAASMAIAIKMGFMFDHDEVLGKKAA